MPDLTPADRTRLVKLLGLLASDQVGERAAAALKAAELVKGRGLTWSDILGGEGARRPDTFPASRQSAPSYATPIADIGFCARHLAHLNAWESEFVLSLVTARVRTAKQMKVVAGVADRLRSRGLV